MSVVPWWPREEPLFPHVPFSLSPLPFGHLSLPSSKRKSSEQPIYLPLSHIDRVRPSDLKMRAPDTFSPARTPAFGSVHPASLPFPSRQPGDALPWACPPSPVAPAAWRPLDGLRGRLHTTAEPRWNSPASRSTGHLQGHARKMRTQWTWCLERRP